MKVAFWKSDWFIGLAVTTVFIVAYLTQASLLRTLEFAMYDAGIAAKAEMPDDRIVVLDIDDNSIGMIGRWPWPRSEMAEMLNILREAGARMIGVDVFYSEKQISQDSESTLKLAQLLQEQADALMAEAQALDAQGEANAAAQKFDLADSKFIEADKLLAKADASNGDARLSQAVREAGNVFMPMFYEAGEPFGRPDGAIPDYIARMNISNIGEVDKNSPPISAVKLSYPFEMLSKAAAGIGYLNVSLSSDGMLRTEPLIVEYYGQFFPSMSLAMVASDLNLTMDDIRINIGSSVELGALTIPTDHLMRISPAFYENSLDKTKRAFTHFPFYDVKTGKIPLSLLRNKIVLIGVTATGVGESYNTPISIDLSTVDYHANVLESMLNNAFISAPDWAGLSNIGLLILVGLYLIFLLPRLSAVFGTMTSVLLLLAILGGSFVLLAEHGLWVQWMVSALLLLVGHIVLTSKRFFASEEDRVKISSESAETNKMLALSFQSQGMLDMAFDKFRKCPRTDDILTALYTLALDFERKRQFNKATAVYEYILEAKPGFKDVKQRIERTKDAGESMIFGGGSNGMGTLMITGGAKPTLGRYEIIKELGKGAMGTVYLGKDPKINREVAIKTMALSQEFEGDELQDVKNRFFREAETAGMLNHPNIVTMYDAGEEHDLAYIAMEFLDGTDLAPYTKKGKLLPQIATLKIVGKVAEALHYASLQHVVHRDIKPANIMLLKDKTVKVTDFGIARITASSKTKTGIVLGTPSYMSPEQLSGKHVDGRSDIFSLGVMLYEMLVGVRPFKGDSMATLLFQIANEPHPDIREFDPSLPEHVSKLINAMLQKDPDKRIPNGAAVIRGIIACLKVMANKEGKQ